MQSWHVDVSSPGHGEHGTQSLCHPSLYPPGDGNPEDISFILFCLCVFFGYLIPSHTLNVKYLNNYMEKIKPQNHHKGKEAFDHKTHSLFTTPGYFCWAISLFIAVILVPLPHST